MEAVDGSAVTNITGSRRPGARFDVGSTAVRYTATDRTGARAQCEFIVNVVQQGKRRVVSAAI